MPFKRAIAAIAIPLALAGCVVTTTGYQSAGYYERPYRYYGPPRYSADPFFRGPPRLYAGRPRLYCRESYFGPDRCFYR